VGTHKLHALLGEEPVAGSPLSIAATAGPLALHCCRLADEAALVDGGVVAGDRAAAVLATADAHGQALAAGGAHLAAVATSADGAPHAPAAMG
jgi:hypothetical protein